MPFQLTDWLAHTPLSVIAKNFRSSMADFSGLPAQQLYIFPDSESLFPRITLTFLICNGTAAPADDAKPPENPLGQVPSPFTFAFSQVNATQYSGGSAKIADTRTFGISTTISVAEVTVEPGAMRFVTRSPTFHHDADSLSENFMYVNRISDGGQSHLGFSGTLLKMNGLSSCGSYILLRLATLLNMVL